jgi:histidinol-phosphate aminotransferase
VRLDQNENLLLPEEFVQSVLQKAVRNSDARLYHSTDLVELRCELSDYVGVTPDCLTIGAGSDDLIRLVTQAVLRHGDRALIVCPTFSMYSLCTVRSGGVPVRVHLNQDFSLDFDRVLEASHEASLVFLCSPNNPTGNQFESRSVLRIIEDSPGLVMLDEAYVEFAGSSLSRLPLKYDNLVVLRTLSKAFGLASLRVGYCIAAEHVAAEFRERLQLPYPVSSVAVAAARRMLRWKKVVLENCARVKKTRQRMLSLLSGQAGIRVFDSQANFILADFDSSPSVVVSGMADRGYLVREIGEACGHRNLVRITVPPPEILDSVLQALHEVME